MRPVDNAPRPGKDFVPAVAWAITGAGHFLREAARLLSDASRSGVVVDVFLSRAAAEVLPMYGLANDVADAARNVMTEIGHSFPASAGFASGRYTHLVVAPATGNTVSKCALGIADALVPTLYAQAGKSRVPICVLPTDVAPEAESVAPNGNRIMVYPRSIDLRMTDTLEAVEGTSVVRSPDGLRAWLTAKGLCSF